MSVEASIDFKLYPNNGARISPLDVTFQLLKYGWTFTDYHGVSYLPLGDSGDFDWKFEHITQESLINILRQKEQLGERIGVVMTWRDTLIGGQFLFMDNETMSVLLTVNRQTLLQTSVASHTDVNWYLTKLLPALNDAWNHVVTSVSFNEHM